MDYSRLSGHTDAQLPPPPPSHVLQNREARLLHNYKRSHLLNPVSEEKIGKTLNVEDRSYLAIIDIKFASSTLFFFSFSWKPISGYTFHFFLRPSSTPFPPSLLPPLLSSGRVENCQLRCYVSGDIIYAFSSSSFFSSSAEIDDWFLETTCLERSSSRVVGRQQVQPAWPDWCLSLHKKLWSNASPSGHAAAPLPFLLRWCWDGIRGGSLASLPRTVVELEVGKGETSTWLGDEFNGKYTYTCVVRTYMIYLGTKLSH